MTTTSKVGIILQARIGSTRLPGKVLMPFGNTTLLGWILARLKELPWQVIVATSNQVQDNQIEFQCKNSGVECFRGSEKDVLDRYYQCALQFNYNHVVRLTGDNPFPDTEELLRMVDQHLEYGADYTHNIGKLPVGVGAEIFSFAALEKSWKLGHLEKHREHVNEYIIDHPDQFLIHYVEPPQEKHSGILLTIDTLDDYQRITEYLEIVGKPPYTTARLIESCTYSA